MMLELKQEQRLYLPDLSNLELEGLRFFIDGEEPNWLATGRRGARLLEWLREPLTVGALSRRYAEWLQLDAAKSWLHVHSFVRDCLRTGMASFTPFERAPYAGRLAHLSADKLSEVWIHTNNSCNLSCTHCLVSSSPAEDPGLPTSQLLHIIDQACECGVERFYFTGGEPFARPDIFELIGAVTEEKQAELIILTNGMLFQGKRLDRLAQFGRDRLRLQISLDGAVAETNDRYRGRGTFDRIAEGTRAVAGLGFPVSLTTVVTRDNLEELPLITRIVKDWGAQSQHLMWMHRRGRVLETEQDAYPSCEDLIGAARVTAKEAARLGVGLDNLESLKLRVNGRPGVKHDLGNQFWDSLCVYSDGTVYPSAACANHKPLAAGVVENGNLRQIWQDSPVARRFRQASVANKSWLREDPFRFILGGGDIEHSYFFSADGAGAGDLHAPDPYYEVYRALARDIMVELAQEKRRSLNGRSSLDAPAVYHSMGEGAVACGTGRDPIDVGDRTAVATLHSNCVLAFDIERSRQVVREFYAKAAEKPQAELCCSMELDPAEVSHIPTEVMDRSYGCGSPIALAQLVSGETTLDLGSGGGIDCFIAARKVGPSGRVIGVDMTDEMLAVANRNRTAVAEKLGYDVVEFRRGFLEQIPVESKTIDLITSNCVINLSPDKKAVFREMWRVLKDHGRIVVSDIVSRETVPDHLRVNPRLWGECLAGALTEEEFVTYLEQAGFHGLQILKRDYWKKVGGCTFYSVTLRGFKFEASAESRFTGQCAVYLGPQKAVMDEEGHLFPRNEPVEVSTDTAAKLSRPPYRGSFLIRAQGQGLPLLEDDLCTPDSSCC